MRLNWQYLSFSQLSTQQLYAILKLRNQVFICEQNCVYLDIDDKDQVAWHLFAESEQNLLAYARIFFASVNHGHFISIGRVVTEPNCRRQGYAKQLLEKALELISQNNQSKNVPIIISAQQYLQNFYQQFGFQKQGEPYLEDNIPHIRMIKDD